MEKKKNNKIISAARVYGIYYLLLQKSESDMDILISALSTNNKVVYKDTEFIIMVVGLLIFTESTFIIFLSF